MVIEARRAWPLERMAWRNDAVFIYNLFTDNASLECNMYKLLTQNTLGESENNKK